MPTEQDMGRDHQHRRDARGDGVARPVLVTITGPIAAGKNTTADLLAQRCVDAGRTVVIADVDDVAAMVGGAGAGDVGLWFAAHEAHGALVGRWLLTDVDVVISVGPVYDEAEQSALYGQLPAGIEPLRVLVEAPLEVTWARVTADLSRGRSRERDFHFSAHARYRSLRSGIPTDLIFDSAQMSAEDIAAALGSTLGLAR